MARKARIHIPGSFHHVMARGIEGRDVFVDDDDRNLFLSLFQKSLQRYDYSCLAWTLMRDHYHLLLRISDEPLGVMMRHLNSQYVRDYGKRHNRKGYLFQDRFKSIATIDDGYVDRIIRYVHLNPFRAKLCAGMKELAEYPWSGHSVLMGMRDAGFQDIVSVFRRFGPDIDSARQKYEEFIRNGMETEIDRDLIAQIRKNNKGKVNVLNAGCWVIGDPEFVRSALRRDAMQRGRTEEYVKEGWTLERLMNRVALAMELSVDQILSGGKAKTVSEARKIFCHCAHHRFQFPTAAIAKFLSVSPAAVYISATKGRALIKKYAETFEV